MIEYKLVPFIEVGHYIAQNADNHHENMYEEKTEGQARVDWEYYLGLSTTECAVSVILDNGEFKGYSVFVLADNPIYQGRIEANNQFIYVEPNYRGHSKEFIKKTNEMLRELGAKSVNYVLGNEKLGNLMSRIGFKDKYTVWSIDYE